MWTPRRLNVFIGEYEEAYLFDGPVTIERTDTEWVFRDRGVTAVVLTAGSFSFFIVSDTQED